MSQPTIKLSLKVTKLPVEQLALTNKVYFNPLDAKQFKKEKTIGFFVQVKGFVFTFDEHEKVEKGFVAFNSVHRRFALLSLNEPVEVTLYIPSVENIYLGNLTLEADFLQKGKKIVEEYKKEDIAAIIIREFENQFFNVEQKFVVDFNAVTLEFRVVGIEVVNLIAITQGTETTPLKAQLGLLHGNTQLSIMPAPNSTLKIIGGENDSINIFRPDWNFESMGIGGLDKEFSDIFRRAFASRIFPPSVISKLGIRHVKGILLYGPPGTGKTLMARQIGKMLNGREPKVVNGPEILNKFVGQSEENIRLLFKEAEQEYKEKGEGSSLHIIIFDEIDAICKQRGSRNDGTGVADTVVNQLLSKIDGVDSLNNILVIGMTNRKDLIDDALLRPGRLEVHMEINLPDENGRLQILKIHTKKMRDSSYMGKDISLEELAEMTKNFSGAEIEGLVKSASSFAFNRQIDPGNGLKLKEGEIKVGRSDFLHALEEVKPAFGIDNDEFENCIRNGIINYGPKVEKLLKTGELFVQQVRTSNRTPLVSVLVEGLPGSGKTALASKLAKSSDYPYVKYISPENLVGYSESAKCYKITKIFEDSYKSPLSCIVVDDLERLVDYVRIGPRFSNVILQTLLVLLKREPPKGRRLLIFATTSNKRLLEDLEFMEVFNATISVPQISTLEEFKNALSELSIFEPASLNKASECFTTPISIKKLIMLTEMARQGPHESIVERFYQIMLDNV